MYSNFLKKVVPIYYIIINNVLIKCYYLRILETTTHEQKKLLKLYFDSGTNTYYMS